MESNRKRRIYGSVSLICLVIAVAAIIYVIRYFTVRDHGDDIYESLQAEYSQAESVSSEESSSEPGDTATQDSRIEESTAPLPDDEYMLREIDFDQLTAEVNSDIYAWIYIPDTNVDYPIFQHPSDNAYYLRHNPDGSEGFPGCIYTELENAKDFSDFNTLIYGHNMKNGTMFHDLRNYVDSEYLAEHPCVYIYTEDAVLKYEIFATYQYDNRHLLYAYSYDTEYDREQYLKEVLEQRNMTAVFNPEAEVDSDSKIITLSTCVHATGPDRYLVQAVLVDEYMIVSAD